MVFLDVDDVNMDGPYHRLICLVYVRYNETHLLNVNKWLVAHGLADIVDYPNEFDPTTWTLYVEAPEEELPRAVPRGSSSLPTWSSRRPTLPSRLPVTPAPSRWRSARATSTSPASSRSSTCSRPTTACP